MKITIELEPEDYLTVPSEIVESLAAAWDKVAYEHNIYGLPWDVQPQPGEWKSGHFEAVALSLYAGVRDARTRDAQYQQEFDSIAERADRFERTFITLYGSEAWKFVLERDKVRGYLV